MQCGIEARHFARIVGIETKPILVISLRCHLGVGWGLRTRLSTICFLPPHRKRSTRENGNNFKHSAKTDTLACCCCCCSQWPISTLRSMRNTGKWSENSWPTSGTANKQEKKKHTATHDTRRARSNRFIPALWFRVYRSDGRRDTNWSRPVPTTPCILYTHTHRFSFFLSFCPLIYQHRQWVGNLTVDRSRHL